MISQAIKQNILLAPLTTFKIGGPAKYFTEIRDKNELLEIFAWIKKNKEKYCILGGGSNILVSDQGFDGLVIRLVNGKIAARGERLECGAGAGLSKAAGLAVGHNLSGLEWAHGIPSATVGGAVRGNAGAFGAAMKDIVETVGVFDIKKNRFTVFSNKDCRFGYRASVFKNNRHYLIWSVLLKLNKKPPREINNRVGRVLQFRNSRQPKLPSAGCVFKNLSADNLKQYYRNLSDKIRHRLSAEASMTGAGALIDAAGLRGKTMGGAKVSLEHANFIVNTGKATAEDVIMLISYIKQQVRDKFGIQLREEIEYLGF